MRTIDDQYLNYLAKISVPIIKVGDYVAHISAIGNRKNLTEGIHTGIGFVTAVKGNGKVQVQHHSGSTRCYSPTTLRVIRSKNRG